MTVNQVSGNGKIQWDLILTGILLVFLASVFTTIFPVAISRITPKEKEEGVVVPDVTTEGIEKKKGEQVDLLIQTSRFKVATISSEDKPLMTPAFITNPD
ncbi:hypothetical protein HZB78_03570 [Candidatus Collierbacteria bacterium]|nr:hypothetical protein [Candidatus Collierbacteria bacterium]